MKARFLLSPEQMLSFKGRISRLQFFAYWLGYMVIIGGIITVPLFLNLLPDLHGPFRSGYVTIFLCFSFALLYLLASLSVRRLHDIGWSGFASLIFLCSPLFTTVKTFLFFTAVLRSEPQLEHLARITFLLVYNTAGLLLTFWPGKKGANAYGPDPLVRPDMAEVF